VWATRWGGDSAWTGGGPAGVCGLAAMVSFDAARNSFFAMRRRGRGRDVQRGDPARFGVAKLDDLPEAAPVGAIGATGWGVTMGIGGLPVAFLRKFDLNLWDQARCASDPDYRPIRAADGALVARIHARVFCAGARGIKTCPGDSGGPVAYAPPGQRPIVVGITSRAKKRCGAKNHDRPRVATRIAAYRRWISTAKKTTGPPAATHRAPAIARSSAADAEPSTSALSSAAPVEVRCTWASMKPGTIVAPGRSTT